VKIKVVGINHFPELTGIAPHTTGMAVGLAAYGHNVNVVTGAPGVSSTGYAVDF
jgi:colanic acid biosynthesis glycosyl transferase WcaI